VAIRARNRRKSSLGRLVGGGGGGGHRSRVRDTTNSARVLVKLVSLRSLKGR
jgi:hypothetical protein